MNVLHIAEAKIISAQHESHRFFTIGHSTRPISEFVDLLTPHKIKLVIDVRAVPRSRANPQYHSTEFAKILSEVQIGYRHIPALGGLRKRSRVTPEDVNGFWKNEGFHNYADYAMSDEFRSGLAELRGLGHATTCAIMCAEAVWWQCHRRIIADYLIMSGETVLHILGPERADLAKITEGARPAAGGGLTYPLSIIAVEQGI
jgi:uncharacterized protein (DUF488 family)